MQISAPLPHAIRVLLLCWTFNICGIIKASAQSTNVTGKRPVYAIAHRVLTAQGVKDALANGANALEIDMCAWTRADGWWADHDCAIGTSSGDTARKMFETIAEERQSGKTINFVWLDLKNPDNCDQSKKGCSIESLRDLSRELLQPHGVRVLFGFYKTENGRASRVIRDSLNDAEAISVNGKTEKVLKFFEGVGSSIPPSKRVIDYGYFNLGFEFGSCKERNYYTCTELRQASEAREQGKVGRVFGWTSAVNQGGMVGALLGIAHADGLIYGFKTTYYYDDPDTRAAAQDIIRWVQKHSDSHYLATQNDKPW